MTKTLFIGGTIITADTTLKNHTLVIENGVIQAIQPGYISADTVDHVIDATGQTIIPGLIDVHVHGGDGHDTMDATPAAIHGMARFFAQHGVTSYYPTTMTDTAENIQRALENVAACPHPEDGAQHLGVHVEGPFLSPHYPGAQPPTFFRPPQPDEYAAWMKTGVVRLITVAPELDGALPMIEALTAQGVEFAAGHTNATYAETSRGAACGLRQVTHTFNGMRPLNHREPGILGAALTDDRLYAQIIADGVHTHPAMVKLLFRAKGAGRVLLITDAMSAAGLPDGDYTLGAQSVTVKDGVARIPAGNLAGSTLTLDRAVRNTVAWTGLSLAEILPAATSTPAEAMNLTNKGRLVPGMDADIVLLDEQLEVSLTMVGGRVVYRR
ncbi:MAG: N-acetylglucosamine-6-phosphate deacetylase [Anaerolineaceae bacterium]|nr:N-acetylglucosamine-6-phosphate deacetylase [Anaerolineaceae bacterium]